MRLAKGKLLDTKIAEWVEDLELRQVGAPPVADTKAVGVLGVEPDADGADAGAETSTPRHSVLFFSLLPHFDFRQY